MSARRARSALWRWFCVAFFGWCALLGRSAQAHALGAPGASASLDPLGTPEPSAPFAPSASAAPALEAGLSALDPLDAGALGPRLAPPEDSLDRRRLEPRAALDGDLAGPGFDLLEAGRDPPGFDSFERSGRTGFEPQAERPVGRGGPWLGVSGGFASSPGERRRVFGLLELGVPLDDWLGARTPALSANETADSPEDDFGEPRVAGGPGGAPRRSELRGAGATLAGGDAGDAGDGGGAAGGSRLPLARRQSITDDPRSSDPAALAWLARAAVTRALQLQGGGTVLRRLDGMAARSRAAASLPEVRLGAGTSRDQSLRLTPTAADPARFTRDGGRDLWLEARLTWRLDNAIFAHDELAIMRLRAQQREETARLTSEVLDALVSWQRARRVLASDKAPPDERDAAAVHEFGAVARLDVLTEGWFSRQLARPPGSGQSSAWP